MQENEFKKIENQLAGEKLLTITYALYAIGIFLGGIPSLCAIIIDYVKKDDYESSYLISHFHYQIRTFWISLGLCFVGFFSMFYYGIGFLVFFLNFVWFIYRIIKGYLKLNDKKPMS